MTLSATGTTHDCGNSSIAMIGITPGVVSRQCGLSTGWVRAECIGTSWKFGRYKLTKLFDKVAPLLGQGRELGEYRVTVGQELSLVCLIREVRYQSEDLLRPPL